MKAKLFRHLCILSILASICTVKSWPTGAPESTCNDLLPKHGSNTAKSAFDSPFILTQSSQEYDANEKIKVTVTSPSGISFKGLMVQAFDPNTNNVIGKFQAGRGLKTIDSCSAVTHSDRRGKRSATLVWSGPANSGNVSFRGTVVQRFSDYYSNLIASVDGNV